MADLESAGMFRVGDAAYDRFMGRYSRPLAGVFADAAGVAAGQRVLDVGCGPGALTGELRGRLGAASVCAIDPSEPFVEACARLNPGVDVRHGSAEDLPYADREFDAALAELVFHFVSDPLLAAREMARVVRPGGTVGACVWDFAGGMTMLRVFWEAALVVNPRAPDEAGTLRFGRDGELGELFAAAGLREIAGGALDVEAAYDGFDDFWQPFLGGAGPAGAFCASLDEGGRARLREGMFDRLGCPSGPFALPARAWYAVGTA